MMDKRDISSLRDWARAKGSQGDLRDGWDFGYSTAMSELISYLDRIEKTMEKHKEINSLLGKQVRVVLDNGTSERQQVVAEGKFLGIDEGGEIVLEDDMGFVHYAWPMLEIEEVTNSE